MNLYWIDIETPQGTLNLWALRVPIDQMKIAKELGYKVAYGREGAKASKSWPKDYQGSP